MGLHVADKRSLKRRLLAVLAGVILGSLISLAGVIVYNTAVCKSRQPRLASPRGAMRPREGFAERLAAAIRFPTVASDPSQAGSDAAFRDLHDFLKTSFTLTHSHLRREVHGQWSLLYVWKGTGASLAPVLLMSHLDVVPVESATEKSWTHPPFAGQIADDFIWGRGALDVKCGAVGLLEAVERLLESGFQPACDVYLALGHDEENGGRKGNAEIARALREQGVHFRFVLDEGGSLTEGIISGIDQPVAFVGIAEKGYATVRLTAGAKGGHSSMPPKHTAVGMVAAAVARLESNPFPARVDGAAAAMLDFLAPEMPWPRRAALANRWLTAGMIARQFAATPSLNAQIRTTMAATVIRGGVKDNVLPMRAEADINVRLLPGDSAESALKRIEAEVRQLGFDDEEGSLTCSMENAQSEASSVSSTSSPGFRTLQRTIAEIYPDVVVTPGLSMVATDSRHYAPIASGIYRFLPFRVTKDDLKRIHGVDERIGIKTYAGMISFLARLIENLSSPEMPE